MRHAPTILQAEANHVDSAMFSDLSYFIAFLQNDSAAMDRLVTGTWATAPPVEVSALQADTAAYHGQLNRSPAIQRARNRLGGTPRRRNLQNIRCYD